MNATQEANDREEAKDTVSELMKRVSTKSDLLNSEYWVGLMFDSTLKLEEQQWCLYMADALYDLYKKSEEISQSSEYPLESGEEQMSDQSDDGTDTEEEYWRQRDEEDKEYWRQNDVDDSEYWRQMGICVMMAMIPRKNIFGSQRY